MYETHQEVIIMLT